MNNKNNICILSIDIGTTRSKAMLYKENKGIIREEEESYNTYYPNPGFVEQDPDEVFAAVLKLIHRLMDNAATAPKDITALCFGGVLQSLLPVDIKGNVLHRAMLWSDNRSFPQNEELRTRLNMISIKQRTGCGLYSIYFPSRLIWMQENIPDLYKHTAKFISIKEYILNRLFGGYHVDHSIASGTGIWNMHTRNWDPELLSDIGIESEHFSECLEPISFIPGGIKRKYASLLGLIEGTPGIIGASDGALSHLGSAGTAVERMSLTVGTGAALRKCVPLPYVDSSSEEWCYYLADNNWLRGGVLLNAGNVFRWFADNLMPAAKKIKETFKLMDQFVENTPIGSEGLFFIPLLSGERTPRYRPDARGVIFGLTLAHSMNHIVRSLMEGLAYNIYSVYRMLDPDSKAELVASGGVLNSSVWLKIISDFLGKTIWLPGIQEVSAWGGIILGLRATSVISNLKDLKKYIGPVEKQEPVIENWNFYQNLAAEYERINEEIYKYERRKTVKNY